jgi:hypothetical protein
LHEVHAYINFAVRTKRFFYHLLGKDFRAKKKREGQGFSTVLIVAIAGLFQLPVNGSTREF